MLASLLAGCATAQAGTATVFSPDVNDGDRSVEYRISYVPADGAAPDVFSHRFHFQYAFDDRWRARLIGSQRSVDGGSLDYRWTRLEVQWQYREHQDDGWDGALRFEYEDGDESPDRLRVVWAGQVDLGAGWQLRGNVLFGRQFGALAASGIQLETRAQLTRSLGHGMRLGVEMFNDLNSTGDYGSFDEQEHQLGPIFKANLGGAWTINLGYLAGLSDSADDGDWRFMIVKGL